jgi:hypothetical protein
MKAAKRVIGIMAAILAGLHMQTATICLVDPQGSPRSDKLIAASVQWAEKITRAARRKCHSIPWQKHSHTLLKWSMV